MTSESDILTLSNLFETVKKSILLVLAIIVAFAAVGALYSFFFIKREYSASASLIVTVKPEPTVKTIVSSDGKTYTITDDSVLNAENSAASYACWIAGNSLAFFNRDNKVIYSEAIKKYEELHKNDAKHTPIKVDFVGKSVSVSSQSSQIFVSYSSTASDPDKMLKCIIESFLAKINEEDETGESVFKPFSGRITVLSEPCLDETNGRFGSIVKYTLVFAVLGFVVAFCVVVVKTLKNAKKKREKND